MKTALVGYTGFVGSNIYEKAAVDGAYNSKNIEMAYGTNPDVLIYAGLRAEKYLANSAPKKDMNLIRQAEENISKIKPRKMVLISTIDVFKLPKDVDENSLIDTDGLHPYGYNRYQLELWVRENYPDALIVRLPGLFGKNIKKNFIYDYMSFIPFILKKEKYKELLEKDPELDNYYKLRSNGFYQVNVSKQDEEILKKKFKNLDFSALNFTDSRSVYQFYNLSRLWGDIQIAIQNDITLLHLATEPISAAEIYQYLTEKEFKNELEGNPAYYNYKTIHASMFGGEHGYICAKEEILNEIKKFVTLHE